MADGELRKLLSYIRASGNSELAVRPNRQDSEKWSLYLVSYNPAVNPKLIQDHPEVPWNRDVQMNVRLIPVNRPSADFLLQGKYQIAEVKTWIQPGILRYPTTGCICRNSQIRMADILSHEDIIWFKDHLSFHFELTMELILAPPVNWVGVFDLNYISSYAKITLSDVLAHPELPWNYSNLVGNSNLTIDEIQAHPQLLPNWFRLSLNRNLTLPAILAHPEMSWNWDQIVKYGQLTFEEILDHGPPPSEWSSIYFERVDFPLEYLATLGQDRHLSRSPNLTLTYILAHPEINWDYAVILQRLFAPPILPGRAAAQAESHSPGSYLSLLPQDMLFYYLSRYVRS